MAAVRTEKFTGPNGEWEAPVYTFAIEGHEGDTEVIGWNGMDEDNENSDMPWGVYKAEDRDGDERYIAVPEAVAEEIGLNDSDITPRKVWRKFLNNGDDWTRMMPGPAPELAEDKGRLDLVTGCKKIATSGKRTTIGEHCLQKGDELMGTKAFSTLGPVLDHYTLFMDEVIDMVKAKGSCYIDPEKSEFFLPEDGDMSGLDYKIEFKNLRLEQIDAMAEWSKPYDSKARTKSDLSHKLYGDIVILKKSGKNDGNEIWAPVALKNSAVLADIPAMNMGSGLFKHNGHEYAINNTLTPDGDGWRMETAGMKLMKALETGIWEFCHTMARQLHKTDLSNAYRAEDVNRIFKKVNMNSGFDELFLSAKGAEKDIDEEMEELYDTIQQDLDEKKEAEENKLKQPIEEKAEESDGNNEQAEKKVKPKRTQSERPNYKLKKSAQYAKNHGPIPRDALTVNIKNCGKRAEAYEIKRKDGNETKLKDDIQDTQNYHFEFNQILDGAATPEGKKAVLVGRLIPYSNIDFETGEIKKPCFTPEQLKHLDEIKKYDQINWVSMSELRDKVYVRAGQVRPDGTFKVDEHGKLEAQKGGYTVYVTPDKVDYIAIDPKCDHTAGAEISGLNNNAQDNRVMINGNNAKETSPDPTRSAPSLTGNGDKGVGQYLIAKAKGDGVIKEIKTEKDVFGDMRPSEMVIAYDNGNTETIDLKWQQKQNSTYLKGSSPSFNGKEGRPLQAGDRIEKGQILTDTNGVVCGQAITGRPALVLVAPGIGVDGTDDSVVLSHEFADDTVHIKVEEQKEEIITSEAGSPYGVDLIFNQTIGKDTKYFGGFDCSKLGPDGLIEDGATVSKGDILGWRMVPNGKVKRTLGEQMALPRPEPGQPYEPPEGYKLKPIVCTRKVTNAVVRSRRRQCGDGRDELVFEYYEKDKAISGFKGSIGGVKGVVKVMSEDKHCNILSCGTAPSKLDGARPDIIVTGNSYQNRKTIGPYIDGLIERLAFERGVVIDKGVDSEKLLDQVMDEYRKAGWGDGTVLVSGWISEHVYIPKENPIRAFAFIASNYMDVDKDPNTNKSNEAKTMNPTISAALEANGLTVSEEEMMKAGKVGSLTRSDQKASMAKTGTGIVVSKEPKGRTKRINKQVIYKSSTQSL